MPTEQVTGRLIERVFPVGTDAELRVNNVRGNVRVTGHDTTDIKLRIEVDPNKRLSDELISHAAIDLEYEGNLVSVRVLTDKSIMSWFEGRSGPPEVRCTLEVPVQTRATLSTVSADVGVGGLRGRQVVSTVSGQIVTTEIDGDQRLNTVSGDGLITECIGALRWNSVSGGLTVRDGRLSELHHNSVSGDCTVDVRGQLEGGATIQTVSGDARLQLDPTFGCEASLTSMSGTGHCDLPARVEEARRGRWRAIVQGGGPQVRMSSMSGALHLMSRTAATAAAAAPASTARAAASAVSGNGAAPVRPARVAEDADAQQRKRILEQVERGELSIDEAMKRLETLAKPPVSADVL